MSSIAPFVSREVANRLAEKKIRMLDAPVSGGEPMTIDGTLSIMVGGSKSDFDEFYPLLKAMGASVVLCGAIGAGNVAKLANQIVVDANIAVVSEALVMTAKAGVNPDLVYQAIRGGLAGSAVLNAKAPLMMDRKFNPGFRINLHIKDLANALETGHQFGAPRCAISRSRRRSNSSAARRAERPPEVSLWNPAAKPAQGNFNHRLLAYQTLTARKITREKRKISWTPAGGGIRLRDELSE